MKEKLLIKTRILFIITLIVIPLTIISVWQYGLNQNKSIIDNSFISTTILFFSFFCFLLVGLYKGISITNDLEIVAKKVNSFQLPKFSNNIISGDFDGGEGILGFIIGILVWLAMTFLIWAFLAIFDAVIWAIIASTIATLYWIFYRALYFVFKNSSECKEKLIPSIKIAFGYATLYAFWIYVLLFIWQYYSY